MTTVYRLVHTFGCALAPFHSAKFRDVLILRTNANGFFPALLGKMVPQVRIELTTYPLPRDCATTTLLRQPWYFRTLRPESLSRSLAEGGVL